MNVRRVLAAAAVALWAAGLVTGCSDGPSDPAPGEARVVERSGTIEVSPDGRTWKRMSGDALRRGEHVRVRRGGAAVLALAGGTRAELRDGSHVAVGRPLRLMAGDLLVRAGDGAVPIDASSAVASVAAGGDARLERGLAFDTAVYDGAVDLRSGSRTFRVRALRQASVPGLGLLPERAQPLRYRPGDAWDREFLGVWMELGSDLEARSKGLSGQVGRDQGRTAGFYRLLLPELDGEPAFTQSLVDETESLPPGERLVGAALASAGTVDDRFEERWRSVFAFRSEGAAWGLVALDQRVRDRPRLVTQIDAALSRVVTEPAVAAAAVRPVGVDDGGAGAGAGSSPGGSNASPSTTSPSSTVTTSPSSPSTTQPPAVPILPLPTLPPPEQDPVEPSSPSDPGSADTIGQLTDTLVATVGGLLGGLQPTPP